MSGPTTEAGRAYLAEWEPADGPDDTVERVVLAIEAESHAAGRAEALGEVRERLEPVDVWTDLEQVIAWLDAETKGDGHERHEFYTKGCPECEAIRSEIPA